MADLATLGLAIDSRPLKDFGAELEKIPAKADATEAATKRVSSATQQLGNEIDRANSRARMWGTTLGTMLGGALQAGMQASIRWVQDYAKGLNDLIGVADHLQTSLAKVYEVSGAGKKFGLGAGDIAQALEGFGAEMDKARYGASEIQKWLKANNDSLLDSKGHLVDFQTGMEKVANLVQNAHSYWEKQDILMAAGVGKSAEMVRLFEQGGAALRRQFEESSGVASKQEELVYAAREFEREWKTVVKSVTDFFIEHLDNIGSRIASLIKNAATGISYITMPGQWFREQMGLEPVKGMNLSGSMNELAVKMQADIDKAREGRGIRRTVAEGGYGPDMPLSMRFGQGTASFDPSRGMTKRPPDESKKPKEDGRDDFDRVTKQIEDQTRRLEEQITTYGKSTYEIARYRAEQELTTAAQRAGRDETPALRDEIDRLSNAYAAAAEKIEQMRQKSQQFKELQSFFGNEIVDVLDRATERGADLSRVFDDVAAAIKRAALQALILGQGPLAGLFGTAAPAGSNSAGGLFGWLSGSAKGWFSSGAEVQGPPMPASVAHTGGLIGWDRLEGRFIHPAYFDDAPRYHTGGMVGLGPDEYPIIGRRGEEVLTRDDPRHRWNGGGASDAQPMQVIVNNNHSGANVTAQESPDGSGGRRLEVQIDEMVAGAVGRGRMTGSALRTQGVRPPVLQA